MSNGLTKVPKFGNALKYKPSVDPNSPFGIKWAQSGGESRLGEPLTDEYSLDDDIGRLQVFQRGAIFWSPAFVAVLVSMPIFRKWISPSVTRGTTALGASVQAYMGYPTEDYTSQDTPRGIIEYAYFERGMIFVDEHGAFVVYGPIYVYYRKQGGVSSFLGSPISDEEPLSTDGRASRFNGGDIVWQSEAGAHELHGAIRQRWIDLGGPDGLGYPLSDEEAVLDTHSRLPTREVGRFGKFQRGSI